MMGIDDQTRFRVNSTPQAQGLIENYQNPSGRALNERCHAECADGLTHRKEAP